MTTIISAAAKGCGCGAASSGSGGCGCGGELCDDPVGLERVRFFPRQLVGPEDLTQHQRYFREKHRRHNRMMHGWGIVCGCGVRQAGDANGEPRPFTVCVDEGYVLAPYGDEIVVDRKVPFDVRRATDDPFGACPPPQDPWCAQVRVDRDPEKTLYLAIRYAECATRPVPVESCGCGCADDCEYSRIVDGFELGVLDELPDAYATRGSSELDLEDAVECTDRMRRLGRPCPPCPTSPWVVLADITVGTDGAIAIDAFSHRRYVAAFGAYGFFCAPDEEFRGLKTLDDVTHDVVVRSVSQAARDEVEGLRDPRAVLSLPAKKLRGAAGSQALAEAIGSRTVAELASTDSDVFVSLATSAGAREDTARTVHDRARLLARIAERPSAVG